MSRLIRLHRLLLAGALALAAALSLTQVAHAGPPAPKVPPEIRVDDANNKVFLIGHAVGVQIHEAQPAADGSAPFRDKGGNLDCDPSQVPPGP